MLATTSSVADATSPPIKIVAGLKRCTSNTTASPRVAAASRIAEKAARERNVTYIVEADGPIGVITYTDFVNNQMGQEQSSDEVMGPVKKVYKFDESDFGGRYSFWSLGVNAQAGAGTSKITCRILLNNRELAKQTSTGQYSVVSCNASG